MNTITTTPTDNGLGILRYRADHFKYPTPTADQEVKFLNNVERFRKEHKFTREEAINLAFSLIHWFPETK
jgi:hypothetical protein